MSDPVFEAVTRAVTFGDYSQAAAAREALAPLRAKHQRRARQYGPDTCTSCRDGYGGHADWPTGTDRLLYSTEELG